LSLFDAETKKSPAKKRLRRAKSSLCGAIAGRGLTTSSPSLNIFNSFYDRLNGKPVISSGDGRFRPRAGTLSSGGDPQERPSSEKEVTAIRIAKHIGRSPAGVAGLFCGLERTGSP